MKGPFIAVDWGTTNRRVFQIAEDGEVILSERDARGILAVGRDHFEREARELRRRLGDLPLLCAGMVGSARGWRQVPYVTVPANIADLARAVLWSEPGEAAIVPGVSLRTPERTDVMRGEEVQFLGAVAATLAPSNSMLCQPGTHCKWAQVQGDRLVDFTTAMTGEVYSLLRNHSLLAEVMEGPVHDGAAFREGVSEALKQDLLASLFGARAAMLLNSRPAADSAAFVSGLLIGSDVRARIGHAGVNVHVLGDPPLASLYAAAIEICGGKAHQVDSAEAFVAGITRVWSAMA